MTIKALPPQPLKYSRHDFVKEYESNAEGGGGRFAVKYSSFSAICIFCPFSRQETSVCTLGVKKKSANFPRPHHKATYIANTLKCSCPTFPPSSQRKTEKQWKMVSVVFEKSRKCWLTVSYRVFTELLGYMEQDWVIYFQHTDVEK